VGVRGDAYATRAPSGTALLRAVAAAEQQQPGADAAADAADAIPPSPVCPACWGALQAVDDPLDGAAEAAVRARYVHGASPGGGPSRVGASSCAAVAIAAALAASGYARAPFSLDASLPGALAARQVAQLAVLARDEHAALAARTAAPPTPLRDALKAALAPALATAHGAPHAQADGPLRCALTFAHDDAAAETAFLCVRQQPRPGAKRPRWHGGKDDTAAARKPTPESCPSEATSAADAEYNATARAAGSLPAADLLAGYADNGPFASPASALTPVLTVAREPLYLGGYYLKALRGVSQSPWDAGDGSVQGDVEAVLLPALKADSAKVRECCFLIDTAQRTHTGALTRG
jgi:hypothetical protein